jgi:gliding motility-associated-like protein
MAYSWIEASTGNTFSSSSISGLAAGIYSLSITDANNCSDTASYQLVQPAQLVIDSISVLSTRCHVWSAQVYVEGGTEPYQFLWSAGTANNQMSVADLSAGTIAVSVTDAKACPASDSVTIVQPGNIVITLNNLGNEPCYGNSSGSINVTASGSIGPYSYRWNDAAATAGPVVNGLPTGSYQVDVTDADQCTAAQTYAITQPDSLQPGTPQITNIGCAGGKTGVITANPVGGTPAYHYVWVAQVSGQSYSTQTISNLGAGSYQLTVTDTNNCSVTVNYQVTAIPLLNFALVVDSITCFGANDGSVLANITSGTPPYQYYWKGNGIAHDSVFSDAAPGLVTATINDSNNCTCNTCINTVQLTAPSLLTVQNIVVQNALCYGSKTGSIQVNVDGGTAPFNLEWSNGGNSTADSGLQAGVYTLTVSDAHSCKANMSDTITEPGALNLTLTATAAHCFGAANGVVVPIARGGTPEYNYSWSNGLNGDVDSLLVAGAYSCTVHDANQCATTAEAYVAQPSQIAIFATAEAIKCTGQKNGSIAVADSGGVAPYQYGANKSGNNFIYNDVPVQGLDTGWYQVQVMDASGCTVQGSAYVPGVIGDDDNVATSPTSCYGSGYKDGSINITVTTALYPPYQYSLDNGSYQATGAFSGVASGQHTVLVQNGNGCTDTLPAFVNEALPIVVQVTPDSLQVEPGDGVPVQVSYENITEPVISWSPSSGLSCSDCPNPVVNTFAPGTYTVTLTRQSDSSACSGSATLHVTLKEHPNVFVPDIFSPNGDGVNDVFLVFGDNIRTIEMKVFNRWGELVYEGDNQFTGWDGTYKGQMQQPGVYAYTVKIFFLDGTQTEKSGAVALVR